MPTKKPTAPGSRTSVGKKVKKSAAKRGASPAHARKKVAARKKSAATKQPVASKQANFESAAIKPEPLTINNHRGLTAHGLEINRRLNANPKLAVLLFLNPVLAMQEAGVKLNKEMSHHILSSLRHRPTMRKRREELEKKLQEALGVIPQPNNSAWLARALFHMLQLQPLNVRGLEPVYKPLLEPEKEARLQARRRKRTNRYKDIPRHNTRSSSFRISTTAPSPRRMDLDAPLPKLKTTEKAPRSVSLESLYFYKESHPLARDLLELAIIQRRGLRLHSRHSIRLVQEGKRGNVFHRWFRKVHLPETKQ